MSTSKGAHLLSKRAQGASIAQKEQAAARHPRPYVNPEDAPLELRSSHRYADLVSSIYCYRVDLESLHQSEQ